MAKYEYKPVFTNPNQKKMRKCLGPCGKEFLSPNSGIRFCSKCRQQQSDIPVEQRSRGNGARRKPGVLPSSST